MDWIKSFYVSIELRTVLKDASNMFKAMHTKDPRIILQGTSGDSFSLDYAQNIPS